MSVLSGREYSAPKQKPPFEDDDEMWRTVRETVQQVEELVFSALGI
jgi:hypothetical protein